VLVPKEAWELLVQWYSLAPGQNPIERKVEISSIYSMNQNIKYSIFSIGC